MIRYLPHNDIDKTKWDECITRAANHLIYGYSWYLDLVCETWDGLVNEDYTAVFPLTYRSRYGVKYLYQPPFTQQLGLFYRQDGSENSIDDFLDAIPSRFRFAEIFLNSSSYPNRNEIRSRNNYVLSLKPDYQTLRREYSQNTLRNLRKASGYNLYAAPHPDINAIITLFRENRGKELKNFGEEMGQQFRRLYHSLEHRGNARAWGVYNQTNELIAGGIFFFDNNRAIFIFSGLSEDGKEKGAMPYLIDNIISQFAGTDLMLDFEGSMDPGLARFYSSFGAELKHYWYYRMNRLPFPLKQIVKLIKG